VRWEDQEKLRKQIEADQPRAKAKSKSELKKEDALRDENEALWAIKDKLRAALDVGQLKYMLEHNKQDSKVRTHTTHTTLTTRHTPEYVRGLEECNMVASMCDCREARRSCWIGAPRECCSARCRRVRRATRASSCACAASSTSAPATPLVLCRSRILNVGAADISNLLLGGASVGPVSVHGHGQRRAAAPVEGPLGPQGRLHLPQQLEVQAGTAPP